MKTISDAGQELAFNRRNRDRGLTWDDIKDANDTLRASSVTKAKVWPKPNYEQMIASGTHAFAARLIKEVYDSLAAKPKKLDDASLQNYIDAITHVRSAIERACNDNKWLSTITESMLSTLRQRGGKLHIEPQFGQTIPLSALAPSTPSASLRSYLLQAIWPKDANERHRFPTGSTAHTQILAAGANRTISKLDLGTDDFLSLFLEVSQGWPTPKESWQVQGLQIWHPYTLTIKPITRRGEFYLCATYEGESVSLGISNDEQALKVKQAQLKPYLLLSKNNSPLGSFDTHEQAISAARDHVKRSSNNWEPQPTSFDQALRTGPDVRHAQDVTSEQLMQQFGFRGVNFGNWVPDRERQIMLNTTFEAWMDLADAMGVPPQAISNFGTMGFALGAQGSGPYAGHFVPGLNEINATRTRGAGVLSHEWGHNLDHLIASQISDARGDNEFITTMVSNPTQVLKLKEQNPHKAAVIDAFCDVMKTLTCRDKPKDEIKAEYQADVEKSRKYARSWLYATSIQKALATDPADPRVQELSAKFESLVEHGVNPSDEHRPLGKARSKLAPDSVAQLFDLTQSILGARLDADAWLSLTSNLKAVHNKSPAGALLERALSTKQRGDTEYYKQSQAMDAQKGGRAYWATPHEMFARAFADWSRLKLQSMGRQSEVLCTDRYASYQAALEMGLVKANPHLHGQELDDAFNAIDRLVALIEFEDQTQKNTDADTDADANSTIDRQRN